MELDTISSLLYLDGIISESTDDLLVVILQAVHPFTVLAVALNPCQSVPCILPVAFHVLGKERGGGETK